MGGLLGGRPKIKKPPPVPTEDTAREETDILDRIRRRRGRRAAQHTGPLGDSPNPAVATKKLLGGP